MIGGGFSGAPSGGGSPAPTGGNPFGASDPITAGLNLASAIIGTKQIGGIAPAYDADTGQLLDTSIVPEEMAGGDLASILAQYFQPSEALDPVGEATTALPMPVDTPSVQAAPDAGSLDWFKDQSNQMVADTPGIGDMMGPPEAETPNFLGGLGDMAGDFFGNMDENMQSPSKTLGLGLLGQIDPRLGYAGLLSMGLLGKNKLFGK